MNALEIAAVAWLAVWASLSGVLIVQPLLWLLHFYGGTIGDELSRPIKHTATLRVLRRPVFRYIIKPLAAKLQRRPKIMPANKYMPLTAYRVTYSNGEVIETSMASDITLEMARNYYLRYQFELDETKPLVTAIKVERIA